MATVPVSPDSSAVDRGIAVASGLVRARQALRPRAVGLGALTIAVIAALTYLQMSTPLMDDQLSRSDATRHWPEALASAGIVVSFVALVESSSHSSAITPPSAVARTRATRGSRVLSMLHIPLAALAALVAFQVLHMGEHTVQITQLLVRDGDLSQSHGLIGRLDFEAVHFAADISLWIGLGALVVALRGANLWLIVAFLATSVHSVEHIYLFWMYHADPALYTAGGWAGIMASGGLVGFPLDRPYLHFFYNMLVTVPMVISLWDETFTPARERGPHARRPGL